MQEPFVNELHPELLSITALNSFAKHNSSARSVMMGSHLSQHLVIDGLEEKLIQSGVEQEFGKHTFSVCMPENGRVIKIIERYPRGIGKDSLPFNPETIVIYENEDTKEIDYFSIPYYRSLHQFFGFKYKHTDAINKIKPGSYIGKGTKFSDTPAVSDNGSYMYGLNLNTAFMSIPSVSEDGVMISEDVLDRLKFRIYETRTVSFGSDSFPLNIYGNREFYKPFPEIGELIKDTRDDGILMMLRTYQDHLAPVDLSIYDTMQPDFVFDKAVYVRGGHGRVVDIQVLSNNDRNRQMPEEVTEYINKYHRAYVKFHQEIIDTEQSLRQENKKKYGESHLKLSPKFHALLVEALAITNHKIPNETKPLNLLYRKAPIDEYMIKFVVEYEIRPNTGFKLTDTHGGKGVICKTEKPENMPIDEHGNRADIVLDPASTISRMNLGRLYEQYFGAASRDVGKQVRTILGLSQGPCSMDKVLCSEDEQIQQAYQLLLQYYKVVSTKQYQFYNQLSYDEQIEHLANVVEQGVYLYIPIDNDLDTVEMVKAVEALVKPTYGPVSYVGNSGQRCVTVNNVRIAPMYIMLLDKIADEWSSVSTGRLQHFGILSPTIKSEKFSFPYRNSPVRTIGETEGRIYNGYAGAEAIAEMMDRSNNPMTQRHMSWNILDAKHPSNIDKVVDRDLIPLGNSKNLQLVTHFLTVTGTKLTYKPENSDNKQL